jgi:hypothetical protein
MAGPMAIASMGMSAIGGIFGAMGAKESAEATSNMYQYKAGVAQANAQIAAQNALQATQVGGVQAQLSGLKTKQQIGAITAAQAASGIDVNSGTAAKVRTSQLAAGQFEQGAIRSDAARKAYGFQVEAANKTAEAQLDIMGGKQAIVAGGYQEATSLLGGATGVADKWTKFGQAGVGGSMFNTNPFSSITG